MAFCINYEEILKDGTIKRWDEAACFSGMYYYENPPKSIRYPAKIYNLSKEQVIFYIDFLTKILDKSLFTYEILDKAVNYELKTENLTRIQALLYLTAFRKIHEFSELLTEFYKFKDEKNIDLLFQIFQNLFYQLLDGKIGHAYGRADIHGLIYSSGKNNYLTIKEFHAKLKDKNAPTVQSCFSNGQIREFNAPIAPPEPKKKLEEFWSIAA